MMCYKPFRGFPSRSTKTSLRGFTLIELMVALAIFAIMLSVGVPGMRTLLSNMDVRSSSDKLINTLAYARSEAVTRLTNVTVCSSSTSSSCSGTWADGWIVFIDDDGDGALEAGDGDEIVRAVSNASEATTFTGGATVTFDTQGLNTSGAGITFTVSKTHAVSNKVITVSEIGFTTIN